MVTVSIHGSHHAAVAIEHAGRYLIMEAEQHLGRPASGLTHFDPIATPVETAREMYVKLRGELGISGLPITYLYSDLGVAAPFFVNILEGSLADCKFIEHHRAHAANSFYQSPFEEALVITCDSGGDDGVFNIYLYKRGDEPKQLAKLPLNLGYTFGLFGDFIKQVRSSYQDKIQFLTYADKIMNLAQFGDVNQKWLPVIERLFRAEQLTPDSTLQLPLDPFNSKELELLRVTLSELLRLSLADGLDGMQAYDLAATVQRALENVFMSAIKPYIEAYPSMPLCLGGGVAKNIYLNQRVQYETGRPLFVPLNPDNTGIALGMIVAHAPPAHRVEFSRIGPRLLDLPLIDHFSSGRPYIDVDARQVAIPLADGKILGIARGNASHGSYSLGSRSIVADASAPHIRALVQWALGMKHGYKPFDALVRAERLSEYAETVDTDAYPNFPLQLKPKYKAVLGAISHVDGTVRAYAVHKEADPWLYEVLRWFETYSGHGILLTAPLVTESGATVSTIESGLHILENSMLEGLVIENRLFYKARRDKTNKNSALTLSGAY